MEQRRSEHAAPWYHAWQCTAARASRVEWGRNRSRACLLRTSEVAGNKKEPACMRGKHASSTLPHLVFNLPFHRWHSAEETARQITGESFLFPRCHSLSFVFRIPFFSAAPLAPVGQTRQVHATLFLRASCIAANRADLIALFQGEFCLFGEKQKDISGIQWTTSLSDDGQALSDPPHARYEDLPR